MAILVDADPRSADTLASALGPDTVTVPGLDQVHRQLDASPDVDVLVLAQSVDQEAALRFAESLRVHRPAIGVILVRRRVDTTVLTEAMRAGVREVVAERDLAILSGAARRARDVGRQMRLQAEAFLPAGEPHQRARVVTVFSAKGGSGKTTFATNLAVALAQRGRHEVCLVDLDLAFGDVAIALQLTPQHTIVDAVPLSDSLDEPGVRSLLTPHSPGLSCLVAPLEPGLAESVPASLVGDLLAVLKRMFDYVVVDTPPAFTDHVLSAFDASDLLALMATLDIPALKNLKLTLETLDLLNHPRDRRRLVINRADSKVGLNLSEVEKTLRVPITGQVPSARAVPAAINRGVPIVLDEPGHPVSAAVRDFAERHVLIDGPKAAGLPEHLRTDRRGGLFRRRAATT